ncbi:MAG: type VI secretion system baseplate subunit TssF [Thermoguttaceae bacterium]
MSDELLPYYNRELAFLRRLGAEFAKAHPKIAGRLHLEADTSQDPHVERLIEAFALLNARTRFKLEDDFPEITDSMLGVLYPHYQAPVPSMAIVQFRVDRAQGELTAGYTIAQGSSLETETIAGEPCRFRTCYPVTLWPLELTAARLTGRPFTAPTGPFTAQALAVLRLELASTAKEFSLKQANLGALRFFLRGQGQHVFALYELLMNNTLGIALAGSPADREPVWLDRRCLQPVGFERDQGMFPYAARSFLGYRLLTEFFTFPQKFLFVDLIGLDRQSLRKLDRRCEIYVYLNRSLVDLEQNVTAETVQLGCAPIVNLYRQRAEPISLSHYISEYRVVPDARRPLAHEVYSIDQVSATSPDGETMEYDPFYSLKHKRDRQRQKRYWHARRQPAEMAGDQGTEVLISLVDLGFNPSAASQWTLDVETTCINRDLPHRLNLSEGPSAFRLTEGGPISSITCLSGRATPTLRPPRKRGALWRLISHLSLNHWSLIDTEDGADGLREILAIYDFADSADTRSMIEGVLSVRSRRVAGRSSGGFCRGLEVTVHLDEDRFAGHGVYLFAAILERFLGLYCSLNSFSKLIVTTNRREGELRRWLPRAGEMVLL